MARHGDIPEPAVAESDVTSARASLQAPIETAGATIALVHEEAFLSKRSVETGRVRVSTHTETIERLLSESLRSETVDVTRVAIDRTVLQGDEIPQTRVEGDVTIIPILEEVLFVEKRLVLKEELHVRRTSQIDDVQVPVTLRKQRALVERVPTANPKPDYPGSDT